MPKPDRKPDPDVEPDYNTADVEYEEVPQADFDQGADVEYDAPADPDYADTGQAAYDAPADPEYEEVFGEPLAAEVAPVLVASPAALGFAFEVGRTVLPLAQPRPQQVVWRGQLKERHPTTGLVCRVPVYRLDDGYWDCYREEELQVA